MNNPFIPIPTTHQPTHRASDLTARGIARSAIAPLAKNGDLLRLARGLYIGRDYAPSQFLSLAMVAARTPSAVIALLSALQFHGMTTQVPAAVWIALPRTARTPRLASLRLRVVRFSGEAMTAEIDTHQIDGINVCIYSPAKTVIDCFRLRSRVGLDVAIEALRDGYQAKHFTLAHLANLAQRCRIFTVMRPYLEMLG